MRPMDVDTFEAREGWVPANTEGSVWCYRTRGNAGVLAFRRTEDGQCLYEATHQDCYASDETITTTRRVEAVRFAASGAGAAAPPDPASDPAPAESPAPTIAPSGPPLTTAGALRNAWDHYIAATLEFLKHLQANLDDTQSDLVGTIDHALSLLGGHSPATAATAAEHDLPAAVSTILHKTQALLATHDRALAEPSPDRDHSAPS
jgi:hypothetical protein